MTDLLVILVEVSSYSAGLGMVTVLGVILTVVTSSEAW